MHPFLLACLRRVLLVLAAGAAGAAAQPTLHPGRIAPATMAGSEVEGGAVATVGPGDTLYLTVYGRPELSAQVTVDVDGRITAPFLGQVAVSGQSPTAVARLVADGLRNQGYLRDPQVAVEVVKVRSRIVSILGQVERPGRYPIEGRLSMLELLAQAGGLKESAADSAVLLRRGDDAAGAESRTEIGVGTRDLPSQAIRDLQLQAGDVLYVPQVARFYVYGEVGRSGAYPMEQGLDVMRALAIAGGLTARASERRISISRKDAATGAVRRERVPLGEPVRPGDVIHVDERIF